MNEASWLSYVAMLYFVDTRQKPEVPTGQQFAFHTSCSQDISFAWYDITFHRTYIEEGEILEKIFNSFDVFY